MLSALLEDHACHNGHHQAEAEEDDDPHSYGAVEPGARDRAEEDARFVVEQDVRRDKPFRAHAVGLELVEAADGIVAVLCGLHHRLGC